MDVSFLKRQWNWLTFRIGHSEYGFEMLKIQDIVDLVDVSVGPHNDGHFRWVLNHRDRIIPVMDMRHRLGLPESEIRPENSVIVVIQSSQKDSLAGILVDAVNEVLWIGEGKMDPLPEVVQKAGMDFVEGLVRVRGRVVVLLNIDKLIAEESDHGLRRLRKVFDLDGTMEPSVE